MQPKTSTSYANEKLLEATSLNDLAQVQHWLPLSDPKADNGRAIQMAAKKGFDAIFEALLPVSEPADGFFEALRLAAELGHEHMVRQLLPVSTPKANFSAPIGLAAINGHTAVVQLLAEHSDCDGVWDSLYNDGHWDGMELLSPYISKELLEHSLQQLPHHALPKTRAHLLQEAIDACLNPVTTLTSKPRL